jgi:flavin-binding protein dodecin
LIGKFQIFLASLKFDYQARTTQDSVRLRLRAEPQAVAARLSVQVDAPEHGWTSGRITVAYDTSIDLPTRTLGENQFRLTVFDGSGLPVTQAASTIVITRTHSTAAAIPATQTIAVKVRSGSTGHVENGKVAHYQVNLKIGFTLEDHD